MAKIKNEKENEVVVENENNVVLNEQNKTIVENSEQKRTGPSYDELLGIVKQLAEEVSFLKSRDSKEVVEPVNDATCNNVLADILSTLANRKSDREVSIVHNKELNGGLSTHIELTNTIIDFKHVGETRLLSWQQFEECASKYRTFFDAKIILVDKAYAEIADYYNLPCTEGSSCFLTQKDIAKLALFDVPNLEKFIDSLSKEDKDTVFSYWLGKCYSREAGFYDRHKMDTLNRLSGGKFDNILLVMNGEGRAI